MAEKDIISIAQQARAAAALLQQTDGRKRSRCLKTMAEKFVLYRQDILDANTEDVAEAEKNGLPVPLVKRLKIDDKVFDYMHTRLARVADLPDPVGRVLRGHTEPSGLVVEKISVPLGVVAMIYESRPNVTTDAVSVCMKSCNAVILRGGSESLRTNMVIQRVMHEALRETSMPEYAVQMILSKSHEDVNTLLGLDQYIDVLIPRGGKALIKAVSEQSSIPVIKHYDGICHLYIAPDADIGQAVELAVNSKCQKVEVCNALETLLVDKAIAEAVLPELKKAFDAQQVELRGCARTMKIIPGIHAAVGEDWHTEYLAAILSVMVVDDQDHAHRHIAHYGSQHTDAIATQSIRRAEEFIRNVDSSSVMINASTRLSGGNDYGQGAVIGISTNKLHARGPVGPEDLTTYKWVARGNGHLRE
ncbi:MAG: glutamate-5-semialdehyde dehydrogenase [Spirochaetales bacterium]|nr:glutamate-5-semialdehyde dehydrogenase [Spirochaetales bacterium]